MQLVKHMSAVFAREGAFSIEIAVDSQRRPLSFGFWEDKQFVCMPIVHCARVVSTTKCYNDLMSRLLSAISNDATIICCGDSSAEFVKVLDKNPGRKAGVQYRFVLPPLQFEGLLHKTSFSVMGKNDMCSMLRTLLLRLNGLLGERWVQSIQCFRRVCVCNIFLLLP